MDLKKEAEELGLKYSSDTIKPGDMYLAGRNTGPHLLTCVKVTDGYIVPKEFPAYCYNEWDCVKILD